jgi:hypothetical protein
MSDVMEIHRDDDIATVSEDIDSWTIRLAVAPMGMEDQRPAPLS